MEHPSVGSGIEGVIRRNPTNGSISVSGRITQLGTIPQQIHWKAAAPVTRGIGFAGSGQPYPNRQIAFENTPNKGIIASPDGSFTIHLKSIPAGYFTNLGSVYVPPLIEFQSFSKQGAYNGSLWINDTAVPYRWINGSPATLRPTTDTPESTGRAMYYIGREQIPLFDNQEALLRAKGFPSSAVHHGWAEADDAQPWNNIPAPA